MKQKKFYIITAVLTAVISWCFYSGIFMDGELRTGRAKYSYFNDLAGSFMQGRLDVVKEKGEPVHDLVSYKGKYYLYWPPVPALVYIPLRAAAGGGSIDDNLVTAFFGALNIVLLALILLFISARYNIKLSRAEYALILVFWAFGTVHFYLSMSGKVWAMSQIMAQTFLLASAAVMFSGVSKTKLVISGLFFAMAVYTRNNLVFSFFLFAAVYLTQKSGAGKKDYIEDGMIFLSFFVLFSSLYLVYNAARFNGRIFENGIQYHLMSSVFRENYEKHGYISVFYIPYNFFTEVLLPMTPSLKFPFFRYDPKGFGFLWASPLFVLIFPAAYYFKRKIKILPSAKEPAVYNETVIMAGAAASAVLIAFIIFMIMGNGRSQLGARYTLDFNLMMVIFCVFALKDIRQLKYYPFSAVLLIISVYVNYFGARMIFGYL